MKRIINLAILIVGLMVFQSFTTISNSHFPLLKSTESNILPITIVFNFSPPGSNCWYHVEATINTFTGTGTGNITQHCPHQNPRTLYFNITSSTITLALKGQITVTTDELADFVDAATKEETDVEFSVKKGIADGITDNGTFDN